MDKESAEVIALKLQGFFENNPKISLAFSGGVDSSYLLYAAMKHGVQVQAYYVKTVFQTQFELDDAVRLADELKADIIILSLDILAEPKILANPENRCYHCKHKILSAILQAAGADGFPVLIDGTNASDDAGDRLGMRVLKELSVRSPLRECGLSKAEIRRLSRAAGLFTWDKPAYACLATRIPTGEEITLEKLQKTEKAEDFLLSLGFSNFRIRLMDGCARLQMSENQLPMLWDRRNVVLTELRKYYSGVLLDFEVRNEQ